MADPNVSSATERDVQDPIEDEPADIPTTLAASVILDKLPADAHRVLEHAGELDREKSMLLSFPTCL